MSQHAIEINQRWTFVNDSLALAPPDRGAKTEYVVEHVSGEGPADRVTMRNLATGGHSQPTIFWLQQGEMDGRPHWVRSAS